MKESTTFDVIVVGAGHAGTEAAFASARMGAKTLLLTHNIETLGQMSCNPAIGGLGKSQLVKEIDALGGAMALATDKAGIQFRVLNSSKGPAVRATRAQADRLLYRKAITEAAFQEPNLSLFQQAVEDLIIEQEKVVGVVTQMGVEFFARAVVLTVGTFLAGKIHIGMTNYQGGRAGDPPATVLAQRLRERPFKVARLKTGTPPRIDGRTIDYTDLARQDGDNPVPVFSFLGSRQDHPEQVPCYITHTNATTHQIIADAFDRSPLFTGEIEGLGPRYCPSIEDKVKRFDREGHQIFIEPEGLHTFEVYPNGISTSLPFDVQIKMIHSIKGFEKARVMRPGYAIEYDFFDPRDLKATLETKHIAGLFFAGQINGTTGYEEAGAQGLIAGANAVQFLREQDPFTLQRHEAYMGVLIDDLITQGTQEPYRMFTSRAEHRLLLREDNADLRLTEKGRNIGLVSDKRWELFVEKREAITRETQRLKNTWIRPQHEDGEKVQAILTQALSREANAFDLLRRPHVTYQALMAVPSLGPGVAQEEVFEQIEVQAKYEGYITLQQNEINKQQKHEETRLPPSLDYHCVTGLSNEVVEKLNKIQPETLGQASRISGVTPAAISLLLVFFKKM